MNYFHLDPDCVALFRFEPGALPVDSLGLFPNLDTYGSPASDQTNFWEGSGSCYFNGSGAFFAKGDGSLPAGFPLKSGDTVKKFSAAFWGRFPNTNTGAAISKDYLNIGRLFRFYPGAGETVQIGWGYGSPPYPGNVEWLDTGFTLTHNQVYHFGLALDGVAKYLLLRIWGATENQIVYSHIFTPVNELAPPNSYSALAIGASSGSGSGLLTGNLDELAIFKDLLTADEIDAIRTGVYLTPPQNPDNCLSQTSCMAIPGNLANLRSATKCAGITLPTPAAMRSHTLSQALLQALPHACLSKTSCQSLILDGGDFFLTF